MVEFLAGRLGIVSLAVDTPDRLPIGVANTGEGLTLTELHNGTCPLTRWARKQSQGYRHRPPGVQTLSEADG